MKLLPPPEFDPREVYARCVGGWSDEERIARFTSAANDVSAHALLYSVRAATKELHLFQSCAYSQPAQIVLNDLTKGELTSLYEDQMATVRRPGRPYYEQILVSVPLGKCPYCEFGHISTLDHFLSKSRYPIFSVLPKNLIPACTDCNKGKGSSILTENNQLPHPYFEDPRIETDTWLYADVAETTPATVVFRFTVPDNWPADLAIRVHNYFTDLKLGSRFAVEATSELSILSDLLNELAVNHQIGNYLMICATVERRHRVNSWKTALYEALSRSVWYQAGGYLAPPRPIP